MERSPDLSETGGSTLLWKEIRFQKELPATPSVITHNSPQIPITTAQKSTIRNKIKGKAKSVKFMTSVAISDRTGMLSSTATSQSTVTTMNPTGYEAPTLEVKGLSIESSSTRSEESLPRISSLCSAIQQHNPSSPTSVCIGILPCKTKDYRLVSLQTAYDEKDWSMVSLGTVLEAQNHAMPKYCWADRLATAVVLASSLLQLPEASWLRPNWTKNNLVFVRGKHRNSYQQVFISRRFETAKTDASKDMLTSDEPMPYARNVPIFTIGLLLIELCFGKSIEQLRSATDFLPANGMPDGLTRLSTAKRLLDAREIFQRRGERYEEAVSRCIFCEFGRRSTYSLEDEGFRRVVDEKMVALLEDDLRAFNNVN